MRLAVGIETPSSLAASLTEHDSAGGIFADFFTVLFGDFWRFLRLSRLPVGACFSGFSRFFQVSPGCRSFTLACNERATALNVADRFRAAVACARFPLQTRAA